MKTLFCLTFLIVSQVAFSQSGAKDMANSPLLSFKCKELKSEREEKIKIRQRLTALFERNQNLLKGLSQERPLLQKKLQANSITLRNELYLSTLQVQNMEESIIRSGCPGLRL